MRLGFLKDNESRVSVTPITLKKYIDANHSVCVEKNAGEVSGFSSAGDPLTNLIERFSFASATSNAVSHGTLTQQRAAPGAASSNTHGYTLGGYIGPGTDMTHGRLIDKFQFNTNSNATTVGTLTTPARGNVGGNTSTTHGYSTGGTSTGYGAAATNVIDKFTFSADNNATTVGTLIVAKHNSSQQNSKTHGYTAGGTWSGSPGPYTNVIDKFSFITDGNATDVGDLPVTMAGSSGHGTSFHGYIAGGVWTGTGYHTRIERVSFASDGNSVEYAADLHTGVGSASDQTSTTHGYISGNATNTTNQIQKYSFASSATGTDVGDLLAARFYNAGTHY